MSWTMHVGDCLDVMRTLPDASVDAIVTDPPAGISFMGKAWDGDKGGRDLWVAWLSQRLAESLRVLKPGGHALVWALPRTSHWTGIAVEDGGFEMRDRVSHLFGTGFPKSLNLGDGLGTALKPAIEDWWLARKPFKGTVAACVAANGTGGLNIDASRIPVVDRENYEAKCASVVGLDSNRNGVDYGEWSGKRADSASPLGRWPANLVLDEQAAQLLDEQAGDRRSCGPYPSPDAESARNVYAGGVARQGQVYSDTGGASRFFYVAKPSRRERDLGCDGLPLRSAGAATARKEGSDGLKSPRAGAGRTGGARNFHPTVKCAALMRWLCRLITPPGGTVLDPFCGSGSTGVGAVIEGFNFIGIEQSEEYAPIARARIRHAELHPEDFGSQPLPPMGQLELFGAA